MRLRVVLAVFVVLTTLTVAGILLVVRRIGDRLPVIVTQGCTVTGPATAEVRLEPEQLANAATIAAVGITRGLPTRAVVVALATAQQESKLYNLTGGDRDSVGLFQQRPSQGWGTAEQISDPRYAAGRFYSALLRVRGWQGMPVEVAAQRVQRSADGDAYQQWVPDAQILADAFAGTAPGAVSCVITDQPPERGSAAVAELSHGVSLDWGRVQTTTESSSLGVALVATGDQVGWRYAHWLVAHAADRGVKSVRFRDQQWTARSGTWTRTTAVPTAAGGERVLAEVYADN